LTGYEIDIISVEPMDEGHALALFRKKLGGGHEEQHISELLHALDYMPLAISQAAAYIRQKAPRISISRYTKKFHRGDKDRAALLEKDLGDSRRDQSASNSIIGTWQISFEYIQEQRPSAARLLSLMSFFDRQGIPEFLLHDRSEEDNDNDDAIDHAFEDDVSTLRSFSLIGVNIGDEMLEMHRLVQFSTRKWLEMKNEEEKWKKIFISKMYRAFPSPKFENWGKCRILFPHAELALAYRPMSSRYLIRWSTIMYRASRYARKHGKYPVAETLGQEALKWRETVLGKWHQNTLAASGNLGILFSHQGRYEAAEDIFRQTLDISIELLGENHPDSLASLNNLASAFDYRGGYEAAERMIRRALEGHEKAHGTMHPWTLTSMCNLAALLQQQGKYQAAEETCRRALDGRMKVLSENHPQTLLSMNKLACILQCQGKFEPAEDLCRAALEKRINVLGHHHPDALESMNTLAMVLCDQGKYGEGEVLNQQALTMFKEVLGRGHPDTLTTVHDMGSILICQEKFEAAEKMYRQAFEGRKKVMGERHRKTLESGRGLASTLRAQGKK
jgi:tetratricopeptide (TPR) repeat protein